MRSTCRGTCCRPGWKKSHRARQAAPRWHRSPPFAGASSEGEADANTKGRGAAAHLFRRERPLRASSALRGDRVEGARDAPCRRDRVAGPMGYGHSSRLHTAKILRLSFDLPIVIEIVDTEAKVNEFLPVLDRMMSSGLITLERVQVLQYGAEGLRERAGLG